MSNKAKFAIPSLDEMEDCHTDTALKSLFTPRLAGVNATGKRSLTICSEQDQHEKPISAGIAINNHQHDNLAGRKKTCQISGNSISKTLSQGTFVLTHGVHDIAASGGKDISVTKSNDSGHSTEASLKKNVERKLMAETVVQTDCKALPPVIGKTNSIVVSPRQRGNPIIKAIRNVPWEFGDIVADYQMGQTTCALFLSLRYHQLNPNYIHERLKQLGHSYDVRVVLVQVDVKDPHHSTKELAKMCILADCTLILAFSPEEAGRYLETYKAFENKPPDLIMEKTEGNFQAQMIDCLTSVRRINKTDAMTLMTKFGPFDKIVDSSEEDLSLCPGFGPQKASKLYSILHEPFMKSKKTKSQPPDTEAALKDRGK